MKKYDLAGILITALLSFAGVVNAQKNPYEAMSVKDTDGNIYKTIMLRDSVWMAENLRTTKFNDGTPIPLIKDRGAWKETKSPGYGWYKEDADYRKSVGAIYNWHAVATKKLCPTGWHVPTDKEWFDMMEYAGTEERSGDNAARLKEEGTTHWKSPNEGATNAISFNALPAGEISYFYKEEEMGTKATWWTSSEDRSDNPPMNALTTGLSFDFPSRTGGTNPKEDAYAVRCKKDNK
jgi:uncharacterized protein (TIGR02145 family)